MAGPLLFIERGDARGLGDHTEIQPAIDAASDGDVIVVHPGEFVITDALTFRGKAITLRSDLGAQRTTIRAANSQERISVILFGDDEGESSIVEGFTITGGRMSGNVCVGTSPTLRDCTLVANLGRPDGVGVHGGSLYCGAGASPTLESCTISINSSHSGGGLACKDGSAPVLRDCVISGNCCWIGGDGGGVHLRGSSPTFERCEIFGNSAQETGGGLHCEDGASPTLTNCSLWGNSVRRAPNAWGGAIFCGRDSSPVLTNCTVTGNLGEHGAGIFTSQEVRLGLVNCIVWGNDDADVEGTSPRPFDVHHSLIGGESVWPGEGNLVGDPLFVSSGEIDFARFVSVEFPDSTFQMSDFDGRTRLCRDGAVDDSIDMGAHERGVCDTVPFRRGDPNADGRVDISDAIFLLNWLFRGKPGPGCADAADTNDSGVVDLSDSVAVFNFLFYGSRPPPNPGPAACGVDTTLDNLSCDAPPRSCD